MPNEDPSSLGLNTQTFAILQDIAAKTAGTNSIRSHISEANSAVKVLLTQVPFNRNKDDRNIELSSSITPHEIDLSR